MCTYFGNFISIISYPIQIPQVTQVLYVKCRELCSAENGSKLKIVNFLKTDRISKLKIDNLN